MTTYKCIKLDEDFDIDGNFGKAVWQKAEIVSLKENITSQEPLQATKAGVLWTDNYLYIGFHVEDDYIWATKVSYNEDLYEEEVVEAFIDDNSDHKSYIEINLNPLNTLLHYYILNDDNFTAGVSYARVKKTIESAVIRNDEINIWECEIKIPMNEFVSAPNNPPIPGDTWLFNLYRIDRPVGEEFKLSALNPTEVARFHVPTKFAHLVFD